MEATHKTIGPLPSVDQLIQQSAPADPQRCKLIQEQLQQWRDQQTLPAKGDISPWSNRGYVASIKCDFAASSMQQASFSTPIGRAPLP